MSTIIIANKLNFNFGLIGSFYSQPFTPLNPDLNIYWDCDGYDMYGDVNQGRLEFDFNLTGPENNWVDVSSFDFAFDISATAIYGRVIDSTILDFSFDLSMFTVSTVGEKTSWLKWTDIGNLDFTQNHSNIAGEMPLYKIGVIYDILKLGSSVIVYGSRGVSKIVPKENIWSQTKVINAGSKNKKAQVSDAENMTHWYVDINGCLWELTEKEIIKLGYEEYFYSLSGLILNLDERKEFLYLCNGTHGYVYSYRDKSLCKGAPNVSSYIIDGIVNYIGAPEAIILPTTSFTTGIYDFGTRKKKTIFNLELSIDGDEVMETRIAYRNKKTDSFAYTPWTIFNPNGIAYMPCEGIEFKFCFRMSVYEVIKIDQLKINGVIHGFSHLDNKRS